MKFICSAGRTEQFKGVAAVGIGSLAACAGLMRALAGRKDLSEIVFLGSCGMYAQDAELLGVYEFSSAASVSTAELAKRAYRPTAAAFAPLNSLEAITASSIDAAAFAAAGFVAENMEAAGVFAAAAALGLKARCVLVASNHINEHSHDEYMHNLATVQAKLSELIENTLEMI